MTTSENNIYIDDHPDHEDLAAVAEGNISPWIRKRILEHIESCESCRFILVELAKQVDEVPDLALPAVENKPLEMKMVEVSSGDEQTDEPVKGFKRPWRRAGDTFFFWVAGSMFVISLITTQLNIHFLAAGAFFGLLAVVDYSYRNIFASLVKAWRDGDDEKADEVIEQLKDRFKIG